jgi:antibiotic biosynthesis monooxygenase (ABM) superfamily enzyme
VSQPKPFSAQPYYKRILIGYIGLFPTLYIILKLLDPITSHMAFLPGVLLEVLVIVPVTQLVSFPLAAKFVAKLSRKKTNSAAAVSIE